MVRTAAIDWLAALRRNRLSLMAQRFASNTALAASPSKRSLSAVSAAALAWACALRAFARLS